VIAVHDALVLAEVGHAFGGALALAYYTHDPRATADIDVNITAAAADAVRVLESLPEGVSWGPSDVERVAADEQVRLWWGRTPVDLFFRASTFHDGVALRARSHEFADRVLPFVAPDDLAVFKALFDRPKDWLDIASMFEAETIDIDVVIPTVRELVGDGATIDRLKLVRAES
jgi:hypothetical protein